MLIFPPEELAQICRRYHIKRLALIGSVLKGTDVPESDVDLLVEFFPGRTPGLFTMAQNRIGPV